MKNYTKEQIEKLLDIPYSVEYELKELIDNKLKQCGIFSRVFSRRKSVASIERKFHKKEYQEGKKIQDLLGIRITLYFEDDIDICKKYLREWFSPVDEWEEYDNNIAEFRASKINGIFELNSDWIRRINPSTWELPVDQTFEIQIRTTFFEGWHEVEHDMRYKNKDIWNEYPIFSRKLNSVVATLELCDSSMVSICEDFAHQLYLDNKWDAMVRIHYRLRMNDEPINPEIEEILNKNSKSLGKRLFRCKRESLIGALLNEKRYNDSINVNHIIMLVNEIDPEMANKDIMNIASKNKRFKDNHLNHGEKKYQYSINPLEEYNNFFNIVTISSDKEEKNALFYSLASTIYNWARDKFKAIFKLSSSAITNYDEKIPGYWLLIDYNEEKMDILMQTYHLSTSEVGKIWSVYAHIYWNKSQNCFEFETKSSILSTIPITIDKQVLNYNPPRFYSEILRNDDLIVSDISRMYEKCLPINENQVDEIIALIKSVYRHTPVVIVVSKTRENKFLDEMWLSRYWCCDLAEIAGTYSHIYRCGKSIMTRILNEFNLSLDSFPGVYLFNTNCINSNGMLQAERFHSFSEDYVNDCVQNIVNETSEGLRINTKFREKAFLHQIIDMIRTDIITSNS